MGAQTARYRLLVAGKQRLGARAFEIRFHRPRGFHFVAGQWIRFFYEEISRDYTLVNGPADPQLAICVRHLTQGRLTPRLAAAQDDDSFDIGGPSGYFTLQPSPRPKIFVATGTGIAPFVSFARDGARDFTCLHGVRSPRELYYREIVAQAAKTYIPCISDEKYPAAPGPRFDGRVTQYLQDNLAAGVYDFYLCGRSEMIGETVQIIDERFEGSLVFTEIFY